MNQKFTQTNISFSSATKICAQTGNEKGYITFAQISGALNLGTAAQADADDFAQATHASEHATGGADPITPGAIGAATTSHTHLSAAITDATDTPALAPGKVIKSDGAGVVTFGQLIAGYLTFNSGAKTAEIRIDNITDFATRTLQSPDKSGTLALTSDISNQATETLAEAKDYTDEQVTAATIGFVADRGSFDASINTFPTTGGSGTAGAILKGDLWTLSAPATSGPLNGYQTGCLVRALVDTPGQTAGNWSIVAVGFGYSPENEANKSGDIAGNSTSVSKYPTIKGLYDWAIATFAAITHSHTRSDVTDLGTAAGNATEDFATAAQGTDERVPTLVGLVDKLALIVSTIAGGTWAFDSTTRPTSAGTGTPATNSLITRNDGDLRFSGRCLISGGQARLFGRSSSGFPAERVNTTISYLGGSTVGVDLRDGQLDFIEIPVPANYQGRNIILRSWWGRNGGTAGNNAFVLRGSVRNDSGGWSGAGWSTTPPSVGVNLFANDEVLTLPAATIAGRLFDHTIAIPNATTTLRIQRRGTDGADTLDTDLYFWCAEIIPQ